MDGKRFDAWTIAFGEAEPTRRALLRRASVGGVAALLAALGVIATDSPDVVAGRRRRRRRGGGDGGGGGSSSSSAAAGGGGGGGGGTGGAGGAGGGGAASVTNTPTLVVPGDGTLSPGQPPTGSVGLLNVALSIHNLRGTVVSARVWIPIVHEIIEWRPKEWTTIAGNRTDFREDERRFALELNTGHIIDVGNPILGFPRITIGTGGWSTNGWEPRGTTLIATGLAEGETARAPGFEVHRLTDTATHKRFLVYLV